MLELLLDPAAWIGLLTLVVLEIVLGIDNLIFIAILTHKLPPEQRDRARVTGLSLAMFMRLALLSAISWLVTLTAPLFHVAGHGVSGRDLILFVGGLFLIYKATTELHERLEGGTESRGGAGAYASFFVVVAQIIVLDAVFSLDSVITAVGMVNQLPVMMAAVVISVGIMLVASKALTQFVNAHPTVVVLCLAFLLMIGLSLLADGLGFHIPKGYLYAAICFAILIEFLNQQGRRNRARQEARRPLRERTAESVLRLLGGRLQGGASAPAGADAAAAGPEAAFAPEERQMVSGVLSLADRNVRSIMTPRPDIAWIDLDAEPAALRAALRATPHSLLPVGRGSLDGLLGVARVKDLLDALVEHGRLEADAAYLRAPLRLPATASVVQAMDQLRQGRGQLALVNNEYGVLLGLVTPLDVLEAIAGEFPDEGEALEIQDEGPGRWRVAGAADLLQFGQRLDLPGMADPDGLYTSVAGFLLSRFGHLPVAGETLDFSGYEFRVLEADEQRIRWVRVSRQPAPGGAPSPATPAGRPAPPGPAAG